MAKGSNKPEDATPLLDLLWGVKSRPRRGPRPTFTIEQIVEAAIAIATTEGLAALSMARLADYLGAATMALYRYIPGKDALVALMLDTIFLSNPADDGALGDWRDALEGWTTTAFAIYQRNPWSLQATISGTPQGPNQLAWLEYALRALDGCGLTTSEMIATVLLLSGHARTSAEIAIGTAQSKPPTGDTAAQLDTSDEALLEHLSRVGSYPILTQILTHRNYSQPEDSIADDFRFGLLRILDGIEMLIHQRADTSHSP